MPYGFMSMKLVELRLCFDCQCSFGHFQAALLVLTQFHARFTSHLREREKLYIFSSHLGLIRCLTPVRVSAIIYFQAFLDKHRNTTNIILPHKLNHGSRMLSKQP